MFQVFRPVEYNLDDLLPLTAGVKVNPPRELEASDSKDDRNPVNLPAGGREEKESLVPETVPERVSVPVSGPPSHGVRLKVLLVVLVVKRPSWVRR